MKAKVTLEFEIDGFDKWVLDCRDVGLALPEAANLALKEMIVEIGIAEMIESSTDVVYEIDLLGDWGEWQ